MIGVTDNMVVIGVTWWDWGTDNMVVIGVTDMVVIGVTD